MTYITLDGRYGRKSGRFLHGINKRKMRVALCRYRFLVCLGALPLPFMVLILYIYNGHTPPIQIYDMWKATSKEAHATLRPNQIYRARMQLINNACRHQRTRTSTRNVPMDVLALRSPHLAYCAVPKAGYTKWLRLLRYLLSNESTTLQETDSEIHNKDSHLYKQLLDAGQDEHAVLNSVRTMTSRDPYDRLWTVYIDKLLLPELWFSLGTKIVQTTRARVAPLAAKCGHDITFPEFIHYVINSHNNRKSNISESRYWLPVSDLCDPCKYNPNIIVKQETISTDISYIMEKMQLQNVAQKFKMWDNADIYIQNVIDHNFCLLEKVKNCISDKFDLCQRIWMAFILRGLIPSDESFPTDIYHDSLNTESFYDLVHNARSRHNNTDSDITSRREHALATAFNLIPRVHMNALRILYKRDFQFFGYDAYPKYLRN